MKGTFFQRPLEFGMRVDGETWNQGDLVAGALTVKNHGPAATSLADIHVRLAHGLLRKVRQKSPDAFEIIASAGLSSKDQLEPGGEIGFEWSFQTDRNCPITDNLSSLFLLYGKGLTTEQLGQLQIAIKPFSLIQEFLDRFVIQFRFVLKGCKHGKGSVEAKLAPPDSKVFASLEHLSLYLKFDGEILDVRYVFNVKGLEASAAAIDMKKKKKEVSQKLGPADYRTQTGRVNHDKIEESIKAALGNIEAKVLF